jgi:chorismate mutase
MNLDQIAAILEGLEETIISRFIDRAQFRINAQVYRPGASGFTGEEEDSLLDIRLRYQEHMDSLFGRFCQPEERPFTAALPEPLRTVRLPANPLKIADYNAVNITAKIKAAYIALLPKICPTGSDGQYGSSVEHDVFALQALSRRIHYGAFFVAEAKYRSDPDEYARLIAAGGVSELEKKLTRPEVEKMIIERVSVKVHKLQADINTAVRNVIEVGCVSDFFASTIIPLTKEGEVRYLLNREQTQGP